MHVYGLPNVTITHLYVNPYIRSTLMGYMISNKSVRLLNPSTNSDARTLMITV